MERPTKAIDRLRYECGLMRDMGELGLVSDIDRTLAWVKKLEGEDMEHPVTDGIHSVGDLPVPATRC